MMLSSIMDIDGSYMEDFFSSDPEKWLSSVRQIKNTVIGNTKQKIALLDMGIVSRLVQLMMDESTSLEMLLECVIVLNSLARCNNGSRVEHLLKSGVLIVLFRGLSHSDLKYIEACLRCLRTIFLSDVAPTDIIFQEPTLVPLLVSLMNHSRGTQECVATLFSCCCKTEEQQVVLCSSGAISELIPLLTTNVYKVQMPTLKCIAQMSYQNQAVSAEIISASCNEEQMMKLLTRLLARAKTTEMQIAAAKCLTNLHRAGVISPRDPAISIKTLSTLVRMCKKDKTIAERVEGAETLSYLIEVDLDLQQTASVADHVIISLASYFRVNTNEDDETLTSEQELSLKKAAFKAFAALGANDEDIRKKIIETENLMDHIVQAFAEANTQVQLAAVRCMHSLSRSVQQLRTSFQDHACWQPLMKMLQSNASNEVLIAASSTLCNLLLEFSPSKEHMLQQGAIDLLVDLTKRDDPALRLNGVWALMNMAFQTEQKVKERILKTVGPDQLFRLLSDPDGAILMKTLGLLRNLLSNKPHIDNIMANHGQKIIQAAVVLILEGDHPTAIKEQSLCILANIADGDTAKDFIMTNDDVLKKLMNYMNHTSIKLQVAAVFCVTNLIWSEDEDALERQAKLKDLGFQKTLQHLLSTNDSSLFDKVKTALQQFA